MLLRCASSPLLKSISVSAETNPGSLTPRRRSSSCTSATLARATSESNTYIPKRNKERVSMIVKNETDDAHIKRSSPFSRQQRRRLAPPSPSPSLALDEGCVGDGGSGGRICSGGASEEDGGFFSDSNKNMDVYYREMIRANPSDPLILRNYAKYLKEVRGDLDKAEEYCERAILANMEDGSVLSMYADIIWERSKDAERADAYFGRAVQAAPEDCYVAASYARFLWDAEEEEEEEEEGKKENMMEVKETAPGSWTQPPPSPPFFFPGQDTTTAIAAAS